MLPHETPLKGYHRTIGGSAGKHTHGGTDLERPDGMPLPDDADYEVTDFDEAVSAVRDDGAKVYVADHITIPHDTSTKWFGDGVTLYADYCNPDTPSVGHWFRLEHRGDRNYPRKVFAHRGGEPAKLYGLYGLGPELNYFDPDHTSDEFDRMTTSFFHEYAGADDGLFEVHGCRFSGWTLAGLEIGARGYRTEAEVHRSTLCMNPMEHLGYGIEHYRGDLWMDRCFMDTCRHAIAGFGYADETIDITNSVFGPGPWSSHAADMHGLANNMDTDSDVAGGHLRIRNCTFMGTMDVNGTGQEGVTIRGVSDQESQVYNSEFWHPPIPNPPGAQGDAVRQESGTNDWKNLRLWNNKFNGPGAPANIGAPRAETTDEPTNSGDTTEPDQPEMKEPTSTLAVTGKGNKGCNYFFTVSGPVERGENAEGNDQVKQRDTDTVIRGFVNDGWVDDFVLSADATLESAWFDGNAKITLGGKEIQLGPLISTEAQRRFK